MPTDLHALAARETINSLPSLTRTKLEHNKVEPNDGDSSQEPDSARSRPVCNDRSTVTTQQEKRMNDLHPYVQALTAADVVSCTMLEEAAFPPAERASREKVIRALP